MQVASAYGHEPVATTSLLAYVLCHEMHPTLEDKVAWLGVLGTFGDLGSSVKWQDPFPDMTPAIKQHGGKTKFSQAVSLINARELSSLSFRALIMCVSMLLCKYHEGCTPTCCTTTVWQSNCAFVQASKMHLYGLYWYSVGPLCVSCSSSR